MFTYSHNAIVGWNSSEVCMYRFIQRHSCTDNSILLCFMSSTNMLTSSIWRRWYLCLTKMLTYCVCFTMLYLYIVFYYGPWPENKVLLLLLFVSDANSTHIYWPLWNGLEATDAEIDTAAAKGIHYTCVGPTSYAWSVKWNWEHGTAAMNVLMIITIGRPLNIQIATHNFYNDFRPRALDHKRQLAAT